MGVLLPSNLSVTTRSINALKPRSRNPRLHSKRQVAQIAESIRTFGFTNPLLVDEAGQLLAGHGRLAAARLLGLSEVPTICLAHMSEAQKRAYVLADNQLALNAGWDEALLRLEFQELSVLDLDFSLTVTGFEAPVIDLMILGEVPEDDPADALPEVVPDQPLITQSGDLWLLGKHRLLCGDARDPAAYAKLMDGKQAQLVFTDPPYNVPIGGHVCGLGQIQHAEFAMASGEMSEAEFTGFLQSVLGQMAGVSTDGAIHFVCMDWRHLGELLTAGKAIYSELKNLCVWNKDNGGMGSLYRSKHELVLVWKVGSAPHINNVALGKHGRNRTNVWDYAGVNTLKATRMEELAMHPTVKPVQLVADAILDCSHRAGIVLDAFCGSGTTLIAAEKTGRTGYGLEIAPAYCDTAIRRWQGLTGQEAVHADTGLTFATMQKQQDASSSDTSILMNTRTLEEVVHG